MSNQKQGDAPVSSAWKAYLPVGKPKLKVTQTDLDFFAQRDVGAEQLAGALAVMRRVRQDVVPLVRRLERCRGLDAYIFLIHGRAEGVPTRSAGAFVDVSLYFLYDAPAAKWIPAKWKYVQPVYVVDEDVAGLDCATFRKSISRRAILCEQSALYLRLVEAFKPEASDVEVLKQVGQFFQFFENMSQLTVR